jgi:hypothetical protein
MKELWEHCLIRCGKSGFATGTSLAGEGPAARRRGGAKPGGQRGQQCLPHTSKTSKASRPTRPCDGPRMNPSVDVGNPPRPFRHLRMAERCSPDPSSSRVPVHSALVQKSVTAITNPAGRLSIWMLGKSSALGKWKTANSWQTICNQSNDWFTNGLAKRWWGNSIVPVREVEGLDSASQL